MTANVGPARTFVVVPAAGTGERFGSCTAKQYADLNGAPVLARTLDRLGTLRCERTFVVLAMDDGEYEQRIGRRDGAEVLRCGGASRAEAFTEMLTERFEAPVESFDPFKKIGFEGKKVQADASGDVAPTAAVAVGLALRRMGDR